MVVFSLKVSQTLDIAMSAIPFCNTFSRHKLYKFKKQILLLKYNRRQSMNVTAKDYSDSNDDKEQDDDVATRVAAFLKISSTISRTHKKKKKNTEVGIILFTKTLWCCQWNLRFKRFIVYGIHTDSI